MAAGLILEFSGVGEKDYEAVNSKLDIDMKTGTGNWPKGLLSHGAGHTDDGDFVVMEVWTDRGAQEEFMVTRLGPALGEAGVAPPKRMAWVNLLAHHTPA
jgi:hypothetical protein